MKTENLTSKEAIEEMTKLVRDIKIAFLLTDLKKQPINAVPMITKKVDEYGNIWFLSRLDSEHNSNIAKDPQVQLLYSHPSNMEYLSVSGNASIISDKKIIENFHSAEDDTWFRDADASKYSAIKIVPEEAYFWDSSGNTLSKLFKRGLANARGENPDIIEKKGKLTL
ncbi:MAG: pyridoxamine 5'-phosphate oxidase family protein [Flavobacteriaceae bacterium]|nr:pyridoxamine 5'-phosphate oxidase family protein [Flavobacteriaceae bacterium]